MSCKLNNRRLRYVLVDTCAPSCITWDTLTHLVEKPVLEPYDGGPLKTWDGSPLPVRGVCKLDFSLGDFMLSNVPIRVVEEAPAGFVIGNDILDRGGETHIYWSKGQLGIGSHPVVQFDSPSMRTAATRAVADVKPGQVSAHVLHSATLRPWTASYVQVYFSGPTGEKDPRSLFAGSAMFFEPSTAFMERRSAHLEGGVVPASDIAAAVWISNFSDTPMHVFAGDLVGALTPLEKVKQLLEASSEEISKALGTYEEKAPPSGDGSPVAAAATEADETKAAIVGEKDRTADDIAEPPLGPTSAAPVFDINPDLPPSEAERIRFLLENVLKLAPADRVGDSKAPPMEIKLKPGAVINVRSYPQRLEAQLESLKIAAKMHGGGVLRPSVSPYNSPVVLARKADGTWRFCVDYRQLNAATVRDAYQLPRPNDLLARLGGATIFSVLDLASAFWQIRLAEEAKQYTAFSLLSGHWEFERVPMGLSNSPSWMQRSLEGALGDVLYRGALAYIDDIIIYGRTYDEHFERLKTVLERLRDYGFSTRPDKCRFAYSKVKFLGHIVSEGQLQPADRNISKIRDCATPTDNKQLESALALFSYYRRFVWGYADLARPLIDRLTKTQQALRDAGRNPRRGKMNITLTADEVRHFEELKKRLCAPDNLLALPDFDKPFVMETDASDFHGHVTLSQYDKDGKLRPVEFFSFDLPATIAKTGAYERELHCVMEGVRHFSNYLDFSQEFEIRIDHRSLQHLHDQATVAAKYARQVQVLSVYNIRWVHQPAAKHQHIDCFTRPPFTRTVEQQLADPGFKATFFTRDPRLGDRECAICHAHGKDPFKCRLPIPGDGVLKQELASIAETALPAAELFESLAPSPPALPPPLPDTITVETVREQQEKDKDIAELRRACELAKSDPEKFRKLPQQLVEASRYYLLASNGLLYRINLTSAARKAAANPEAELPLVIPEALTGKFLQLYHSDATAGHLGFKKAYPRLARHCYWPTMTHDLVAYEHSCDSCIRHKVPRRGPVGTLHSIVVDGVWDMLGMDVLGPLPRTKRGYAYIIVFMDYASRYAIICPLRTQTASEIARVLVKRVLLERAIPRRLLSDRGAAFLSDLVSEVNRVFGITKVSTTAYHPQTDGMVERFNHTLVAMLSHYVGAELDDWDEYLSAVQYAYNTSVHATTGHTPHEMMHTWPAYTAVMTSLTAPVDNADPSKWLEKMVQRHKEMCELALKLDRAAKEKAEVRRDAKSTPITFVKGQYVFRKNERMRNKLDERLLGPYEVVSVHSHNDTYGIRLLRDPNGKEERVHVEKLYPTWDTYEPNVENDLHEDDASDASDAEFRPSDDEDAGLNNEDADSNSDRRARVATRRDRSASSTTTSAVSSTTPAQRVLPAHAADAPVQTATTSRVLNARTTGSSTSPAPARQPEGRAARLLGDLAMLRDEFSTADPAKIVRPPVVKAIKMTLEATFNAGGQTMAELRQELRGVKTYGELDELLGKWAVKFRTLQ